LKYECLDCRKIFMYAGTYTIVKSATETLEFHVCPFCFSKNIDEISLNKGKIVSIQSVKIGEADELIKQGYEVKDTYATTVTLVKYGSNSKPQAEEKKPTLQETISKESEQLRKDLKSLTEP